MPVPRRPHGSTGAGYAELSEADRWPERPGRYFTVRAGSLVAWNSDVPDGPFRIIGAHTATAPTCGSSSIRTGCGRLASGGPGTVRGAWLNSWLDRDLGISGRLSLRPAGPGAGLSHRLVRIDDPLLRVPQLAIHLAEDRASLRLDPQRHVNAVWGVGDTPAPS